MQLYNAGMGCRYSYTDPSHLEFYYKVNKKILKIAIATLSFATYQISCLFLICPKTKIKYTSTVYDVIISDLLSDALKIYVILYFKHSAKKYE